MTNCEKHLAFSFPEMTDSDEAVSCDAQSGWKITSWESSK